MLVPALDTPVARALLVMENIYLVIVYLHMNGNLIAVLVRQNINIAVINLML